MKLTPYIGTKKANEIIKHVRETSAGGKCFFIQVDISLIKNVDAACSEIIKKEGKINVLFLTAGYMTLKGRTETSEGIDRKMCVNYYARMRFTTNLMPQLMAASNANELSRVISVLAAGSEDDVRLEDLDLKEDYTLHKCLAHCVMMTDFMLEELSKAYPGTSFSHSYPGTVKSGLTSELTGPLRLAVKLLYAVVSPWILQVLESGERHLFQITSSIYPARNGNVGVPPADNTIPVQKGMDGVTGSGSYLLDWDGRATGDATLLSKYREKDFGTTVWNHTMDIFRKATTTKRSEAELQNGPAAQVRNPTGWRPA